MKDTEKVMKQVDKEERRRSKLQTGKPSAAFTPPLVVRSDAFTVLTAHRLSAVCNIEQVHQATRTLQP